ncbi:hypothetical protein GE061_007025 [Apolygus lucorum]|uniref:Receptor ligand binding region domain-containing protein n=1 Tax=Apolygus lucorum TaxID=248454 RepID=A0A6A4J1Z4_APOLU|nr:hypothetical protein GE061_007025 [Apolygus lucorum]
MVGRMLKFFTVPLLTTGAQTYDFMKSKTKRDDEFFGVVRVSPSNFITIARSINAFNAKFNWTRFVMLFKPDGQHEVSGEGTCKLMLETLVESFKSITAKMVYRAVNMDRQNDTKKILLEEIGVDYSEKSS